MDTIHLSKTVEKDGEITVTGLPYRKGQRVEVTLLIKPVAKNEPKRARLTARELLNSELVGLWKDRADIRDSVTFARELREQAQRRG